MRLEREILALRGVGARLEEALADLVRPVAPHKALHPRRDGLHVRVGPAERLGDQQVVPHPEELEDRERGDRRCRQGQHDLAEDQEVAGAVDASRFDPAQAGQADWKKMWEWRKAMDAVVPSDAGAK